MPTIRDNVETLFTGRTLFEEIDKRMANLPEAVESMDSNQLLITPIEDLVDTLDEMFRLDVPVLLEDRAKMEDPDELTINIEDHGRPIALRGAQYQLTIPFQGDSSIFRHQPSKHDSMPPDGKVMLKNLHLRVTGFNLNRDEVKAALDKSLASVKLYLSWHQSQADAFNTQLRQKAREELEARKNSILAMKNIAASLGYPMRIRLDAPPTYISDEVRRKVLPKRTNQPPSSTSTEKFQPEPAIGEVEYQHILKVMGDMAIMMERSPRTFAKLKEEEIRDHFLLQLNGHYEGNATGETFNREGKTDILVRENDRNLFIGECKIWSGPAVIPAALDQLLRYLTWRDTKAALIIFVRRKNFDTPLASIKTAVSAHTQMKRGPTDEGQTRFRYVFGKPDDPTHEIIVTVMVFHIPSESE